MKASYEAGLFLELLKENKALAKCPGDDIWVTSKELTKALQDCC